MIRNEILIDVPAIFSWSAILGYLDRDPNEIAYRFKGQSIYRAFRVQRHNYLVKINYLKKSRQLLITCLVPQSYIPKVVKHSIKAFVAEWLDMDTNLEPFYRMAQEDPILSKIMKPLRGLRLIRFPNLYESMTWEILGQQINVGLAYRLKRNFIQKFGSVMKYHCHRFWIFPEPKRVAVSNVKTLFKLGLTHRKAEYMIGISKLLTERRISKAKYLRLPSTDAMLKALTRIRGIGPWGANCVCMRGLDRGDAIPVSDIGLLNGVKKILNLKKKPSRSFILKLQKEWGRWSAYATFYIWRYLY